MAGCAKPPNSRTTSAGCGAGAGNSLRPRVCLAREGVVFAGTQAPHTLQHLHGHFGHTVGFVLVQPAGLRQHHLPKAALSQGLA